MSTVNSATPSPSDVSGVMWVHVTTMMGWSRPAVGVVRVEQEFVRWVLEGGDPQARFCVFDVASGRFLQIGREAVAAKLHAMLNPPPPAPDGDRRLSPEDRLRALHARYAQLIPAAALPRLKQAAKRSLHWLRQVKHSLHLLRQSLSAGASPADAAGGGVGSSGGSAGGTGFWDKRAQPAAFSRGDRFVSMGLDWDMLDIPLLYRLKTATGMHVTLMCYDIIPVLFPQYVVQPPARFGSYLTELAWCADHVTCISECTQRDFRRFIEKMGGRLPQTSVIHLGSTIAAPAPAPDAEGQPAQLSPQVEALADRPFVLFVSTIERRKNHELLYRCWVRLKEQGVDVPRLVFVGMPGWGVSDLLNDIRLDPNLQGDIVMLNHVSDQELAWLYRHCMFTVYPSLYEGWGLPVVESLAWGRYCLCSNAASIPEAGGPWCDYLDPWDLPAWVAHLRVLVTDPASLAQRHDAIACGFVPVSWSQTAREIHAAGQGS